MSTWQIFSDAGNNFRWETSDSQLSIPHPPPHIESPRLPSMSDLLLQGCSKLLDNRNDNLESAPMFRTGSGKSVAVKQSSIAKARSVLAGVDTGQLDIRENGCATFKPPFGIDSLKSNVASKSGLQNGLKNTVNMSNSMFQTGSGKKVNISSAGLLRAKMLLGLDENHDQESLHESTIQMHKQSDSTELLARGSPSYLETENLTNLRFSSSTKVLTGPDVNPDSCRSESKEFSALLNKGSEHPPVKFQTAGGRSISVSSDALQRARNLLGNPEFDSFFDEASTSDPFFSVIDDGNTSSSNQKNEFTTPFLTKGTGNGDNCTKNFTSPFRSDSYQKQPSGRCEKLRPGNNLITKFDAEAAVPAFNRPHNGIYCDEEPLKKNYTSEKKICSDNGVRPKVDPSKRSSNGPLGDISNTTNIDHLDNKYYTGEKRRLRKFSSPSPFKKPRSSFVTPLNKNNSSVINALSRLAPKEPCCKERVSMRYPLQVPRLYLKEYFLQPSSIRTKLEKIPQYVKYMDPVAAESYKFQTGTSDCIGPKAFYQMLSQCGASIQYLTEEWVSNHYKWIVWKLASYERCYPAKFSGKLLTVSGVLEELKYRYEREVNHGNRSAIKKVLDGDAPPSSMMVLCISSVGQNHARKVGPHSTSPEGDANDGTSIIELTDGWYSVKAQLDEPLSQKLASKKLFMGQKLRIWGAKLCGWVAPISPLEASQTTSLLLHMNGTYRCHWAERLGFCKSAGYPLAFRCIKGTGGTVPSTLVGITRIYPVLYKERLNNGSFVVRPERVEAKVLQLYNQRRDVVVEGVISAHERETERNVGCDDDGEGAKLMKLLETAAEPEVLMAGMSSNQLALFSSYKAKLEAMRQSDMHKSIEKALEAAGLTERDVSPFLRVRVVGLTKKCHSKNICPQKGLITIWNPTQKQILQLSEGQAYAVGDLVPSSSDSGTLYLQARGSTSKWLALSTSTMEKFEPFFTPRSSVSISSLGAIPLSSEFDIAALVVYVGDVYAHGHQQKQWVFVTDGSDPELCSKESSDALLAINFCLPYTTFDSLTPVNSNIAGSVVCFCNLIKRSRDQVNGLFVAEATENSDYFLSYDHAGRNHFKDAASSVSKWAKTSSSITEQLKENILSIIRNSKNGC